MVAGWYLLVGEGRTPAVVTGNRWVAAVVVGSRRAVAGEAGEMECSFGARLWSDGGQMVVVAVCSGERVVVGIVGSGVRIVVVVAGVHCALGVVGSSRCIVAEGVVT